MAARDDFYRSQKGLDIVFALSCVAMVAALLWMFVADYDREFKTWQRKGREVEVALLQEEISRLKQQNAALVAESKDKVKAKFAALDPEIVKQLSDENFVNDAKRLTNVVANDQIRGWLKEVDAEKPAYQALSAKVASSKAQKDSLVSFRDILFHQGGPEDAVQAMEEQIDDFVAKYLEPEENKLAEMKEKLDNLNRNIADARKEVTEAVGELSRLVTEQVRLQATAEQRTYGPGAAFRNLPIIDAFAPPFKVRQDIPEGLTIDYTFKQVQRLDRCASCHMFIDKSDYTKDRLAALKELIAKLRDKDELSAEEQVLWNSFPDQLKAADLNAQDIAAFCGHPRQELFVGSNSPHPVEKFGCTICHGGQGGSTSFKFAYHFPDTGKTDGQTVEDYASKYARWTKEYNWLADLHPNYLWDSPQMPARFVESSCVKCHHQILDLVTTEGKEQAPKLLKGYRLVRELGCFGCHEIAGFKSGRSVGPDMRLEPFPPLEDRTPEERAKLLADPSDAPGTMRKNGPNLRRVAEKTDAGWMERWIRSPRGFRAETRMPHYYGLQNNHPTQLSDYQKGESQLSEGHRGFPDAEIRAMTFYLLTASKSYLRDLQMLHSLSPSDWQREMDAKGAFKKIAQFRADNPAATPRYNDPALPPDTPVADLAKVAPNLRDRLTKDQLRAVLDYYADMERTRQAAIVLETRPWPAPELGGYQGDAKRGEQLFQVKGCLACHGQEKVRDAYKDDEKMAELLSDAHFGPPLVGLREKLGADKDPKRAQKWLYSWLTNPGDYHPRTFMPNPQLDPKDRADIMAWLLGDGDVKPTADWANVKVGAGDVDGLTEYYLEKALATKREAKEALKTGIKDVRYMRPDADERLLAINQPAGSLATGLSHDDRKLLYLGRKTITRNGCFACHDIPGFETAKPIGVPLNDWGKKDAERLAFENINDYLHEYYSEFNYELPKFKEYDPFFKEALGAKRRDGYLHQKLFEPRTYDWQRFKERSWDDHIKMPQFKFARAVKRPGESERDFARRAEKEERESREAVMTFILGLTAEGIPSKFIHQPREDRAREIAGLHLIEKFNCNACHIFKPGGYEVALDGEMKQQLQKVLTNDLTQVDLKNDPGFPDSSAWRSRETPSASRLTFRGLPRAINTEDNALSLEMWDAAGFKNEKGEVIQLPAGQAAINIPLKSNLPRHEPYGGAYTDIHSRVLARLEKKSLIGDRPELMGSSPPPLMREGQKIQPRWLLEFLQAPIALRPSVYRHLKMPHFNMNEEEAQKLVNYFIAVDRILEKPLGLEYFAPRPEQWSPTFHERKRADYRAKLKQFTNMSDDEIAKADYFEAGWKLIINRQLCLQCHNAGTFVAEGELIAKAPAFYHAPERLRPEYIHRWVSVPKRTIPYTKMNWFEQFYHRDNYGFMQMALKEKPVLKASTQLANVLGNLGSAPITGGFLFPVPDAMLQQMQVEFVLRPDEKVQAARDAIQSWGFLKNPGPIGTQAGPRQDSLIGDDKK